MVDDSLSNNCMMMEEVVRSVEGGFSAFYNQRAFPESSEY